MGADAERGEAPAPVQLVVRDTRQGQVAPDFGAPVGED